jgi:hypothetical protein
MDFFRTVLINIASREYCIACVVGDVVVALGRRAPNWVRTRYLGQREQVERAATRHRLSLAGVITPLPSAGDQGWRDQLRGPQR